MKKRRSISKKKIPPLGNPTNKLAKEIETTPVAVEAMEGAVATSDTGDNQVQSGALSTQQNVPSVTFNYGYNNHHSAVNTFASNTGSVQHQLQKRKLDFIGSSSAVNDLFALPYNHDVDVAVAVHNIGNGVLLLDGADLYASSSRSSHGDYASYGPGSSDAAGDYTHHVTDDDDHGNDGDDNETSNSTSRRRKRGRRRKLNSRNSLNQNETFQKLTPTSAPAQPASNCKEIVSLIDQSRTLTVHKADTTGIRLENERRIKSSDITNDESSRVIIVKRNHHPNPNCKEGNVSSSYAEAVRRQGQQSRSTNGTNHQFHSSMALQIIPDLKGHSKSYHPQHNTISPLSSIMPPSAIQAHARDFGLSIAPFQHQGHIHTTNDPNPPSSSSCIILDSYLDNIITNVPQLGQYFKDRDIIQGIHLLQTEKVPMLSSSNLQGDDLKSTTTEVAKITAPTTSTPAVISNNNATFASNNTTHQHTHDAPKKHDLSPDMIESNAAMLLQFLKTNCFRENSTYLLQRAAGETNIQLHDITSLSAQRHRKWMWWLAMMSYRFALRLKQLIEETASTTTSAEKRDFRERMRGLMDNSLELLHEVEDMDGSTHETICAAVCEHIADSYLYYDTDGDAKDQEKNSQKEGRYQQKFQKQQTQQQQQQQHSKKRGKKAGKKNSPSSTSSFFRPTTTLQHQPYSKVSIDGLSKAQDNLIKGIFELQPLFSKDIPKTSMNDNIVEIEISNQMYKLYHKLIHVTLRLAEHHLDSYWASSAMQALRLSARKITDAVKLLQKSGVFDETSKTRKHFQNSLLHQIGVLRLDCANFARSFAADDMWRERGATCGEDVISLLRDVELSVGYVSHFLQHLSPNALPESDRSKGSMNIRYPSLSMKSGGLVGDLQYLSGIVPMVEGKDIHQNSQSCPDVDRANWILEKQKLIPRERRRVLVASSVCYSHACDIFSIIDAQTTDSQAYVSSYIHSISPLIKQRLGDTCNEIGSIMLKEIKKLIQSNSSSSALIPLLQSAEFWFKEGLSNFRECEDKQNVALLLCNLSQCCKIYANTGMHSEKSEKYLEQSAKYLELAHETLEQKDNLNKNIWDNVSLELANVFLVLGVNRRQNLLQMYNTNEKYLGPGLERSIVQPMQRALGIFISLREDHQFAATNYQLALLYAKTWTYQRDEIKTRERLSLAFKHFSAAHQYFFSNMESNESTFVLLSLDTARLYAAISGVEKALLCCFNTSDAFAPKAIDAAKQRGDSTWFERMVTLASNVEDLTLNFLLTLAKTLPKNNVYKNMYRYALTAKRDSNENINESVETFEVHKLLTALQNMNKGC